MNSFGDRAMSWIVNVIILCAVVFIIAGIVNAGASVFHNEQYTGTILAAETKVIGGDKSESYMVFIRKDSGETETYVIKDVWGRWNSADTYFWMKSHIGAKITYVAKGYRNPFFSQFANIVDYVEVPQ